LFQLLKIRPAYLLAITLVLHILLHSAFLKLPPCSIHVWRQCNTLAVARNFFEEDNNLFKPRVDTRGTQNGVTGMQFPAYEWGLANIYKITGEHFIVHRIYSLVISCFALVAIALFFGLLFNNRHYGVLASWIICWSPEFFYHSINALPDILAFCFGFFALYFSYKWKIRRERQDQFLSFLFITLAGLIKIQFGIFGIFMAVSIFLPDKNKLALTIHQKRNWFLYGAFSILLISFWYWYAHYLIESSNLRDFVLQIRPVNNATQAWSIIKKNLLSDFPELLINYANVALLVLGMMVSITKINLKNSKHLALLASIILSLLWYVLMLEQMRVHQYYMLPFLLISTIFILKGIQHLVNRKKYFIIYPLLLALPVLAAVRILPARWMKDDLGIPIEFAEANMRQQLIDAIPVTKGVIVGPDKSACIWLYFLHKKGYSFDDVNFFLTDTITGNNLAAYRKQGALYLYMKHDLIIKDDSTLKYLQSIGDIDIYQIQY